MEAGAERQRSFLARLGLLKPVPIEFDEVAKPHYPEQWREVNVITIAYGHGIAVTPLHAITAVSAIVNGGMLHPPTLRKPAPGKPGRRPGDLAQDLGADAQADAARRRIRHRQAGRRARLCGRRQDRYGGKEFGGHYVEKKLLSDFIGAFPMQTRVTRSCAGRRTAWQQAELGYATAGWTVAPATSRIIQRIAPILGVRRSTRHRPRSSGR